MGTACGFQMDGVSAHFDSSASRFDYFDDVVICVSFPVVCCCCRQVPGPSESVLKSSDSVGMFDGGLMLTESEKTN